MTDPVSPPGEIQAAAVASQNDDIRSPWYDFFHTFIRHPMALVSGIGDGAACGIDNSVHSWLRPGGLGHGLQQVLLDLRADSV